MKLVIEGQVSDDGCTVKVAEPLPPGQKVFILGEWSADSLFESARQLTLQGQPERAYELLTKYETFVREKKPFPFTEAIVDTLLSQEKVDEALEIADRITDEWDHDLAIVRIHVHLLYRHKNSDRAREVLKRIRNERKRQFGEFLLEWKLRMNQAEHTRSPSDVEQVVRELTDAWGD
ncbi:MAG: hypothetical protein NZ959_02530 [Armatimonadetes bacterium]|nr:hypothetical protein [Armatimonadota bacterium]MDW8120951.1 hypothetical protein [Armatimonadota bacterium]